MLEVRHDAGARYRVRGELDGDGALRLDAVLARVAGDVELECSEVASLDGAGLTALVTAGRACRGRGNTFRVVGLRPEAVARLRARGQLDHVLGPPTSDGRWWAGRGPRIAAAPRPS